MKFIVKDKDYEYDFMLSPGLIIVGREEGCDLTLNAKSVSRQHLSCDVDGQSVNVKDLGSRNGIKVNGKRISTASLKDGDVVSVGEAKLVFKATEAAYSVVSESDSGYAEDEPEIEDEEITPPGGSLVKVDPMQQQTGFYERDGHWYVSDPATGREVEIVPAEQGKTSSDQSRSILATKKGRMIIGGAAAAVLLLLLLSLVIDSEPAAPTSPEVSEREYDSMIDQTLRAIGEGDYERAENMAADLTNIRPRSGAAQSLEKIVTLFRRMDNEFQEYWVDAKRALDELEFNHESDEVRRFVRRHSSRIDQAVLQYEIVENAREIADDGQYLEAYELLQDITPDRPARKDNRDFFSEVESKLKNQLEQELESALNRNNWSRAYDLTDKLISFFPETAGDLKDKMDEYAELARNSDIVREAQTLINHSDFEQAIQRLQNIPSDCRYYQLAQNLIDRAEKLEVVETARDYFNRGNAENAASLIQDIDLEEARALYRRIETVDNAYQNAVNAEDNRDYIQAAQLWNQIYQIESEFSDNSYYLDEAQKALREIDDNRLQYVEELIDSAGQHFRNDQHEEAMEKLNTAEDLIPDDAQPPQALPRLKDRMFSRGEREYNLALNEDEPQRAIERLQIAVTLLPADSYTFERANEKLREFRRELENPPD